MQTFIIDVLSLRLYYSAVIYATILFICCSCCYTEKDTKCTYGQDFSANFFFCKKQLWWELSHFHRIIVLDRNVAPPHIFSYTLSVASVKANLILYLSSLGSFLTAGMYNLCLRLAAVVIEKQQSDRILELCGTIWIMTGNAQRLLVMTFHVLLLCSTLRLLKCKVHYKYYCFCCCYQFAHFCSVVLNPHSDVFK